MTLVPIRQPKTICAVVVAVFVLANIFILESRDDSDQRRTLKDKRPIPSFGAIDFRIKVDGDSKLEEDHQNAKRKLLDSHLDYNYSLEKETTATVSAVAITPTATLATARKHYKLDGDFLFIGEAKFNRSMMVYAQIPKTGSTTLGNMIRSLADANNVHWNVGPRFRTMVGDRLSQSLFASGAAFSPRFHDGLLSRDPDDPERSYSGLGFTGHVRFLDFRRFGTHNPVWVTQIRDPVQSFISWFYYVRRQEGHFSEMVRSLKSVEAAERWRNKSVVECVSDPNDDECQLKTKRSFEPSMITFLCGYSRFCSLHGDARALNKAMENADRFFAVVSLLEHLQESLQLLEHAAGKFLKGIASSQVLHRNAAPKSHEVTPEIRFKLERLLSNEIELYEHLRQRLLKQHRETFPAAPGRQTPP